MKKKTLEDELFYIGLIFLVVGGVVSALYFGVLQHCLPELPCLFWALFGIYCPGCGGTRAVLALMQGRFLESLWYHPLVLYVTVCGGGFMLTQGLHRLGVKRIKGWKYHNWYLYGMIIIVVCNFLIKNLLKMVWGITM